MKNYLKNAYFSQFRNGRLRKITKLYLFYCGRRDAQKKVIREKNGTFSSPFIYHEIHLFELATQIEKERLVNHITSIQSEIESIQLEIDRKQQMADRTDYDQEPFDKSNAEQTIATLKVKKQELSSFVNEKTEIQKLRIQQLYSMLQAKISAYWNGVLHGSGDNAQIPPSITVEQFLKKGGYSYETK